MYKIVPSQGQVDAPPSWEQWLQFPQSQLALVVLLVSVLACVAAWVSASSGFRSAGTARKNLGVAKKSLDINSAAADAGNKALETSFSNAHVTHGPKDSLYVFDMAITNPATRPNSVKSAPLTMILGDGATRSFDPTPVSEEGKESTQLRLPLDLPASSHRSGSVAYKVSADFLQDRRIKRFRVDVTDSSGRVSPVETIVVGVQS